jgi:cyclophilin family peptidyl-prolyl cis-trans isomerase
MSSPNHRDEQSSVAGSEHNSCMPQECRISEVWQSEGIRIVAGDVGTPTDTSRLSPEAEEFANATFAN